MTSLYPRHSHETGIQIDDMDMDSSSSSSNATTMSSMLMSMVFQTSTTTPLYSNSWTPNSAGAYAGTCLFLVALSIIARLLVALKARLESRWSDRDARRRYVVVNGREPLSEQLSRDPAAKQMTVALSANGAEENVVVVARKERPVRPWRFSVDPVRAVVDTLIVGVGYLLMLAVMTLNVGYFFSVLAGTFIGSLCVGRHSSLPYH